MEDEEFVRKQSFTLGIAFAAVRQVVHATLYISYLAWSKLTTQAPAASLTASTFLQDTTASTFSHSFGIFTKHACSTSLAYSPFTSFNTLAGVHRKLMHEPEQKQKEKHVSLNGLNEANVVLLRGCGCRIKVPGFQAMHGLRGVLVAPTKIIAGEGGIAMVGAQWRRRIRPETLWHDARGWISEGAR
eukprot:1136662-Pelagomonas_calceolata.AAC.2